MHVLRHVLVAAGLAGCTLVSGWSDLQRGGRAPDAGTPAHRDARAPVGDGENDDAVDAGDAGGGAFIDGSRVELPPCAVGVSNSSCACASQCSGECSKGSCVFTFGQDAQGSTGCSGAGCIVVVETGAQVVNSCSGGGCTFRCAAGAQCINSCSGGGCTFACAPGACTNTCSESCIDSPP